MANKNVTSMRPHGRINTLSIADAAYIAGIVDADGCVTASLSRNSHRFPSPLLIVTNSDFELITWLKSVVGAGTSYLTKTRPCRPDQNRDNWNPVHRYQLTGWRATNLMVQLCPYMRVKAQRAKLVMQLPLRGRDFPVHATDHQVSASMELLKQIRALNHRGVRPLPEAA